MNLLKNRCRVAALSILFAFAGLSVGCVSDDAMVDENQAGAEQIPPQPVPLTPQAGDRLLISLPTSTSASISGGIIQTHFDNGSAAPLNAFPLDPAFEIPLYDDLFTPMQALSVPITAQQASDLVSPTVTLAFATVILTDGSILPISGTTSEARVAIWRDQPADEALIEHYTTSLLTITQ